MPLPRPENGLVVQYGFIWAGPGRADPPDSGKSRPCLIVDVEIEVVAGREVLRVTYLPISHVAPRERETAIAIPGRIARHLRLTHERSYIYTSYANEDDWPYDVERVPAARGSFQYGFIPRALFDRITADFAAFAKARPKMLHRRTGGRLNHEQEG